MRQKSNSLVDQAWEAREEKSNNLVDQAWEAREATLMRRKVAAGVAVALTIATIVHMRRK